MRDLDSLLFATLFALIAAAAMLGACAPLGITGSNTPGGDTHRIPAEALALAESTDCLEVPSTSARENIDYALAQLHERGVQLHELAVEEWPYATATRFVLFLPKGFWERSEFRQGATLRHELVHYCQLDQLPDGEFERSYFKSDNRWKYETAAYRMTLRTRLAQGQSLAKVTRYMRHKLASFPEAYYLADLDPVQYTAETERIWTLELTPAVP